MKESQLYIQFIKRNSFILVIPLLVGILVSIFLFSQVKPRTKISQSFKMEYSLENVDTILALTDQAVAELRLQRFDLHFPGSGVAVYKTAPLTINIEAISEEKNLGFELLLKESAYLRKNFSVSELSQPAIDFVEPNIFKYLLSGVLPAFLIGLIIALVKEYFKNY